MTRKRHHTDVKFGYYDGNRRTVALFIGEMQDGELVLDGDDLDMVTAAFFHLFGRTVEPGLRHYGLRKYRNAGTLTVTDDRLSIYYPDRRDAHDISFSLSTHDSRPGELRLWAESTKAKMFMNFMMDKATTEEFGRRLASAAEWEVAA
jgi:hypothetical protein